MTVARRRLGGPLGVLGQPHPPKSTFGGHGLSGVRCVTRDSNSTYHPSCAVDAGVLTLSSGGHTSRVCKDPLWPKQQHTAGTGCKHKSHRPARTASQQKGVLRTALKQHAARKHMLEHG